MGEDDFRHVGQGKGGLGHARRRVRKGLRNIGGELDFRVHEKGRKRKKGGVAFLACKKLRPRPHGQTVRNGSSSPLPQLFLSLSLRRHHIAKIE